ncbi:MAG: caspase family protein [Neomegalonema sp.]|nr:caspase family protein [Neomegalonema sp.]
MTGMQRRAARAILVSAALLMALVAVVSQAQAQTHDQAQRRVALVIGNSSYSGARLVALPNPKRDARSVAKMLSGLGFDEVIFKTNLTTAEMRRALRRLRRAIGAGEIEIAALYFAGHAIQYRGENYLFGVEAAPETVDDLPGMAVSLTEILGQLSRVKGLKLVILDACRDEATLLTAMKAAEPDKTRSAGLKRGLARLDSYKTPDDTLVAYATSPDAVALDGPAGAHSPFTAALLKFAPQPDTEIRLLFGTVRDYVSASTKGRQKPTAKTDTMGGRRYYLARTPARSADSRSAAQPVRRAPVLAAPSAPPRKRDERPSHTGCVGVSVTQPFDIRVRAGDQICSQREPSKRVTILKVSKAAIEYANGPRGRFTCYVGERCKFFWTGAPIFWVRMRPDGGQRIVSAH